MKRLALTLAATIVLTPAVADAAPWFDRIEETATTSMVQAERLNPPPPPPPPGPPALIKGDCDSVRRIFDFYDPSGQSSAFFVGNGIAWRESRCGLDTINERTGDSGIVQINPVHNRAGYFGGVQFGDGGWLLALHGLRTRQNTDHPEWANAAITLRQVCGNQPWRSPYGCDNRRLQR